MQHTTKRTAARDTETDLSMDDVWEHIDQFLIDCLTDDVIETYRAHPNNLALTALKIKETMPQAEYQTRLLDDHYRDITAAIGTDVLFDHIVNTFTVDPEHSVQQFARRQAVLCLACFIASELDAYLRHAPEDAERIFALDVDIQFNESESTPERKTPSAPAVES